MHSLTQVRRHDSVMRRFHVLRQQLAAAATTGEAAPPELQLQHRDIGSFLSLMREILRSTN
jgi:hypothetical protein